MTTLSSCCRRLAVQWHWGGRWGSNPRPQVPQTCALPTELRPPLILCRPFLGWFVQVDFCWVDFFGSASLNQPTEPILISFFKLAQTGAPGRTRTCDPRLRRPLLYPAELQAHSEAHSKAFRSHGPLSTRLSAHTLKLTSVSSRTPGDSP
jgi:hypothetical protein